MEILNWAESLPTPWKNGGGSVRPVATHPPGGGVGSFDWRISVAEIEADGPFSAFPGVDRCFVLLRGSGVRLTPDAGLAMVLTEPSQIVHFSGESSVEATLVAGPVQNLSILVARSCYQSMVLSINGVGEQHFEAGQGALVLCLEGDVALTPLGSDGVTIQAGQALLWRTHSPSWTLFAATAATRLVVVRLNRVGQ